MFNKFLISRQKPQQFKQLCAVTLLAITSFNAWSLTPEQQGQEIAVETKKRDSGWVDTTASMTMTLRNAEGQTSVRQMRIKALEQHDDGDKSLTIFDRPRDVKGTAFLSFSHIAKPDDQWLYLPTLKRVKRIASRNKSGPFMGSEFAFEDLSSFEIDKYHYKYLGDEVIENANHFMVEQTPTDKYSGYTRRIAWVDKEHYRVSKVEFYDRKNSLLKTLNLGEYQQHLSRYWRPKLSTMTNHQSGKVTTIAYSNIQFGVGLKDSDFNKSSLKRAR